MGFIVLSLPPGCQKHSASRRFVELVFFSLPPQCSLTIATRVYPQAAPFIRWRLAPSVPTPVSSFTSLFCSASPAQSAQPQAARGLPTKSEMNTGCPRRRTSSLSSQHPSHFPPRIVAPGDAPTLFPSGTPISTSTCIQGSVPHLNSASPGQQARTTHRCLCSSHSLGRLSFTCPVVFAFYRVLAQPLSLPRQFCMI